jgi:NADH:ubiquinone oxidoreductase subunit F (NADH-binding)
MTKPAKMTVAPLPDHVASFYGLEEGDETVRPCRGTACFAARHLTPALWEGARLGRPLYCLGQCFAAPAAPDPSLRPAIRADAKTPVVLEGLLQGPCRSLRDYGRRGGGKALEKALRMTPEAIRAEIESSGLRGRGGAGYPTGRKWNLVARAPSEDGEKFVIANADEGDPGAYIDRFLMEDDPFRLIEALAVAARAVGGAKGLIYLRQEYPAARLVLEKAIEEARAAWGLDVGLIVGRGSYVCGEETALIRAIEEKRPEVEARPPYPAEHGLLGRPTLVNNVETLFSVPWIVLNGGAAYRARGFSKSRGTKAVSLNSLFRRPGLYEVEFGIPVRRIVEDLGGGVDGVLRGLLIGGPLAGVLPPRLFDTPFGFEELTAVGCGIGHGGIVAFDGRTSLKELILHVFAFAADESCGKCTPCRLGSRKVERALARGALTRADWDDIVSALGRTSLCGLGGGLGEFAKSLSLHYEEELKQCLA